MLQIRAATLVPGHRRRFPSKQGQPSASRVRNIVQGRQGLVISARTKSISKWTSFISRPEQLQLKFNLLLVAQGAADRVNRQRVCSDRPFPTLLGLK